jgi:transposase
MATFARLDVSQARTTVCIVDERGLVTWRGSCVTSPAAIAQILTAQASLLERVGLESGPLAPWLVHELRALELPVVCLDARHARAALSMQINKSDANDADGLAQIVRTGWYREVEVKSIESHLVRATLGVRKQLVGMRTEMINQIRGLMKIFGLILPKSSGARFEAGVRARIAEKAELWVVVEPLLAAWHALDDQVAALEQQLVRRARRHEVCHRLMTVPGVGPLTALAFVTTVDDPTRFRRSSSVGAYLGLTPRRHQSGERDVSGRISKCGDRLTRSYLFEAANVLLTRVERWSSLKAWAIRLAKRIGAKKAKVALARKLAVLLHRLWQDGTSFRWTAEASA